LLLIAFVYNNNLAYLLAFLLASIFFITILHSFKSLAELIVSSGGGLPVFAGEAVAFEITIDNPDTVERYNLTAKLELTVNFFKSSGKKTAYTLFGHR